MYGYVWCTMSTQVAQVFGWLFLGSWRWETWVFQRKPWKIEVKMLGWRNLGFFSEFSNSTLIPLSKRRSNSLQKRSNDFFSLASLFFVLEARICSSFFLSGYSFVTGPHEERTALGQCVLWSGGSLIQSLLLRLWPYSPINLYGQMRW
jgi:hypothetical protein